MGSGGNFRGGFRGPGAHLLAYGFAQFAARLFHKCAAAPDGFASVGYALVASLLALAVLEHWFMVLPWEPEKLWAWGLQTHRRDRTAKNAIGNRLRIKAHS